MSNVPPSRRTEQLKPDTINSLNLLTAKPPFSVFEQMVPYFIHEFCYLLIYKDK